jgi:GC-rich sequence DNA-binding factor
VDQITSNQKAYLELNRPQFDPEAIPARLRLLSHQRKLLANILRWKKFSGSFFGIDELVERVLSDVMLPIAETGWDVGGRDSMVEVSSYKRFLELLAD